MSKTWSDVEKEYAAQKRLLSSMYGRIKSPEVIILDDIVTENIHRNAIKQWRILKVMNELEKNSFIKMFNEGWCKSCDFDSSKCAKQHECEAFKVVNKAINKEENGDENGK